MNLINALQGLVTPDLISKASGLLGETEGNTGKAISTAIPALVGGLLNKSGDSSAISGIFNLITNQDNNQGLLGNVSNILDADDNSPAKQLGGKLLSSLFGNDMSGVLGLISNNSGVSTKSAGSLLTSLAPLALGFLGKQTQSNGWGVADLLNLFKGQKDNLLSVAPAGLAGALGLSSLSNLASNVTNTVSNTVSSGAKTVANTVSSSNDNKGGGSNWLLPLLLGALLLGLVFFLMKSCNKQKTTETTETTVVEGEGTATETTETTTTTTTTTVTTPKFTLDANGGLVYDLGEIITEKLPNGTEIKFAKNGAEAQLLEFIKNGTVDDADKTKGWINLYDIQFVKNLDYRKGAAEQVANISAILKAYPNVNAKLGGYTDNTGAADLNAKLSQQRADKVMKDVVAAGIGADRLKAEGYGPEHPVCEANDTPECKAQNRRVSMRVTKK